MTQVELRNLIRREIKDPVKSAEATDQLRWSRAQLCFQINLSADLIAQEFLHIQGTKQWTTVEGTQAYSFSASDYFLGYPAGVVWLEYITETGGNTDFIPIANYVDYQQFLYLQRNASNTSNLGYWSFWNKSLYVPKPSFAVANALTAYVYKKQTELATDGTADDTELDGDTTLHPLVGLHAAMMVAREDRAINLSELIEKKYREELKRQKRYHASKHAGPNFTRIQDF